jgi:hypothetical protein
MTLRLILGIDPGQTGAIALLADGAPAGYADMPTLERAKGGGRQVDAPRLAAALRGILQQHAGAHVVVVTERVQARPGNGSIAGFKLGQADGIMRGVLGALGLDVLEVEPQTWKRHFGLLKTEKDVARQYVMARWPERAVQLLQVKQGGRADAMLVATWAHETEAWIPVTTPARRTPRRLPKSTQRTDSARPAVPA